LTASALVVEVLAVLVSSEPPQAVAPRARAAVAARAVRVFICISFLPFGRGVERR
jgi:hypothetical protein